MKQPEKIEEICDSLNGPYSSAKQYIDGALLKVDIYNDMAYFYDFFSKLDEKNQDTVYLNLQKIYDVIKDTYDSENNKIAEKMNEIKDKPLYQLKKMSDDNFEDMVDYMKEVSIILNDLTRQSVKNHKLNILNLFLTTADNYRRNRESVEKITCDEKCNMHNKKIEEIKSNEYKLIFLSIVTSIIIAFVVSLIILYIYAKVSQQVFVKFIEDNIWPIVLFPSAILLVGWTKDQWKKIIKIFKKKI